jgi:hypothetical protein
MTTSVSTQRPPRSGLTDLVVGLAAIAFLAAAIVLWWIGMRYSFWSSGIAFALSGGISFALAIKAKHTAVRTVAWAGVVVAGAPLAIMFPMSVFELYSEWGLPDWALTAAWGLDNGLLPLFGVALVWAAWRTPKSRVDGIAGEIALVLLLQSAHVLVALSAVFASEDPNAEMRIGFGTAALVYVLAAMRAEGRRIVYGATALLCLCNMFWFLDHYPGNDPASSWLLALVAVPAAAGLLQLAWNRFRKTGNSNAGTPLEEIHI